MTRLSAETMVSNLPLIDHDGLLKVRQALDLLLGGQSTAGPAAHPEGFEAILFDAMTAEFESRGIRRNMPFSAFARTSHYRHWRNSLPTLQDFITKEFNGHVKEKRDKVALCRLLISMLFDELRERDLPLSYGTVAANIGRLAEVFDNGFPGYLQCGMAHIVITMLRRKAR